MRQKMNRKKHNLLLIFMLLSAVLLFKAMQSANTAHVLAKDNKSEYKAVGINVEYHTQEEIRKYVKKNPAEDDPIVTYKVKPKLTAPYRAGQLSDETLESALTILNRIRYIAGISHNLVLNENANKKAQAACLVNAVNDELTHYPDKPNKMDDKLYKLGYSGASSSNLGWRYHSVNSSVLTGYMEDGDSSNISRVGHRRWLLNPSMSSVGFGYAGSYTATYILNRSNEEASEYGVAWPAQNMPTDYFGSEYPWSISMGYSVDRDAVKVILTRLSDNKKWKFSSKSADGYFNVNNQMIGTVGCIIFRPDGIERYQEGDVYQVDITGLEEPVSYQVSFFDLYPVTSVKIEATDKRIYKGSSLYLDWTVNPDNASYPWLTWTSSDSKVAKVTGYGDIEGVGFGTATITATSNNGVKGKYKISVVPDKAKITSIRSDKSKQFTVAYNKINGISGYEVIYDTNSQFTNPKTKIINSANTTKATVSGLKSNQTYYVKVRAYYEKNGAKTYGVDSKVSIVKVK